MHKFKKLTRVTVVVVVLVLLFNILGLVFITYKSDQNAERENLEKLSESQQKLSFQIAQQVLIVSQEVVENNSKKADIEQQESLISLFQSQEEILRRKISEFSLAGRSLNHVIGETTPSYTKIISIINQLHDSERSKMHSGLIQELTNNQLSYQGKMQIVVEDLRNYEESLTNSIYWMNFFILGSLILSLIILALTVMSPVLKQGVKDYITLQSSYVAIKKSEKALKRKDLLLHAVSYATHELLSSADFVEASAKALKRFSITMESDEVSFHKNETGSDGMLFSKQLMSYHKDCPEIKYNDQQFQNVSFARMPWTIEELCEKKAFCRAVSDLKESSRIWFESKKVLSIVTIPVFSSGVFWGFINIYDCDRVRQWEDTEVTILKSLSVTFGSVIERMEMQERLVYSKDLAETASRTKSEFMSNMSHELRTPMNGIIGFTDLILTTELKSSQREYLTNVKKSGYNLLNIINDILDFSKMESGKLLLDSTAFKLHDLIEETAEILSLKALEKGLEIVCVIEPLLPSLFTGDAARIRQIVVNLVGNAIKFTSHGEIVLSVKEVAPVHFVDGKKYLNLAISVKDTGIGIPADKLGAIFENFTQVDASTTRKFGGTGLGLTISRGLAVLMSGSLEAESELGKGSMFTLTLTLEVANEQPILILPVKSVLNNVLVVDDNESNCFLMQSIFSHFGVPCKVCNSGKDALALIEKAVLADCMFDLIVADHQMPEMDGISMIKKIKAILKGDSEPFILMLSSLDRTLFQSEAESAGIDKFLTKPVKMLELNTILSKIFKPSLKHDVSEIIPFAEKMPYRGEILVVEDEPINMLLISEILKARGINVLQAFNGKQALEMLSKYEPAMIFMDVNMPEMDGIAVTRIVRKMDKRNADISIIALTADARREDRQLCLEAGMNDYISKPFRLDDIDKVLNKFYLPTGLRA